MITTLHGLVTICNFFAGFNLINTGVVNCLIMCQNVRKMHHSEAKETKKFSSPDFSPLRRGTPPTQTLPTPGLRRLDTRAFGARLGPQTKILDPLL